MLKQAQSGAEEVDRQLLAILPASDRKTLLECLTGLAAEMDKVEDGTGKSPRGKSAAQGPLRRGCLAFQFRCKVRHDFRR